MASFTRCCAAGPNSPPWVKMPIAAGRPRPRPDMSRDSDRHSHKRSQHNRTTAPHPAARASGRLPVQSPDQSRDQARGQARDQQPPEPPRTPRPLPPQEPDYGVQSWAQTDGDAEHLKTLHGFRCGAVALVGQPNAGKSTLLNRLLGEKLAIVSQRPQTTRDNIRGVLTTSDAQIVLLDTPGIHKARSPLNRAMIGQAVEALESADVVVLIIDAQRAVRWQQRHEGEVNESNAMDDDEPADPAQTEVVTPASKLVFDPQIHPGDRAVMRQILHNNQKWLIALNKVDLVRPRHLLPVMAALATAPHVGAIVPVSAWTADGLRSLLAAMRGYLPESEPEFDADELTDRSLRWLCAELVREQVFQQIREEVPYGVACETEAYEELPDLVHVQVLVHVEKPAQRAILIGKEGTRMKQLATLARGKMEALIGRKVFLEVHVRVEANWSGRSDKLKEFGYIQ
ncbi:MAG: GTPase Era [Myxococcales bacterium]|nr:GTPase Era [Myxococcales bacterium]